MSKYPLPSDDRLEHLIRESFEYMPGPQMSRLDQIEQRLGSAMSRLPAARRVNKTPWWIVLLLTGGFATAAWWAGDRIMSRKDVSEGHIITNTNEYLRPDEADVDTGTEDTVENQSQQSIPGQGNESPVIYQRESF